MVSWGSLTVLANCPGLRPPRERDLGEQAKVLGNVQRHRLFANDSDPAGLGSLLLVWVHRCCHGSLDCGLGHPSLGSWYVGGYQREY